MVKEAQIFQMTHEQIVIIYGNIWLIDLSSLICRPIERLNKMPQCEHDRQIQVEGTEVNLQYSLFCFLFLLRPKFEFLSLKYLVLVYSRVVLRRLGADIRYFPFARFSISYIIDIIECAFYSNVYL